MIIQKQKLFVFVLALARGFGSLYNIAAQTIETVPATTTVETDLQYEIALVNEAAQMVSIGLFIKLSTQYQVELADDHGDRVKTQEQNQNRVQTGDEQNGVPNAGGMQGGGVEANDDAQVHGPNDAHSDTGAQNHGANGKGAVVNGPKR